MNRKILSFFPVILMICTMIISGCRNTDKNIIGVNIPKSSYNTVNMDELMKKWKFSDNWVFIQYNKVVSTEPNKGFTETIIIERNGNITSCIRQIDNRARELSLSVFDEADCTSYYGRDEGLGWNWNFLKPNPSTHKYKIEDFFDNDFWLSVFISTIQTTKTSVYEESGAYIFQGVQNITDMIKNYGVPIDENVPKAWRYFTCTLTFGTSKVEEPLM